MIYMNQKREENSMKKRLLELLAERSSWVAISSVVYFFLNKYYGFNDQETVATILFGINSLYLAWVKEHKGGK